MARKLKKTRQELIDYMHEEYPDDEDVLIRMGMLEAYEFLVGIKDEEEKRRKEISKLIKKKLFDDGFK
jgi:hypothetical protein